MYYSIINTCDITLWGLTQQQRIVKTLNNIADFQVLSADIQPQADDQVLLICADYLIEANVIKRLVQRNDCILNSSCDGHAAAVWTQYKYYQQAKVILQQADHQHQFSHVTAEQLTGGYDINLRKYDISYVVKVTHENAEILEKYLYDKSYKGITDCVT